MDFNVELVYREYTAICKGETHLGVCSVMVPVMTNPRALATGERLILRITKPRKVADVSKEKAAWQQELRAKNKSKSQKNRRVGKRVPRNASLVLKNRVCLSHPQQRRAVRGLSRKGGAGERCLQHVAVCCCCGARTDWAAHPY